MSELVPRLPLNLGLEVRTLSRRIFFIEEEDLVKSSDPKKYYYFICPSLCSARDPMCIAMRNRLRKKTNDNNEKSRLILTSFKSIPPI